MQNLDTEELSDAMVEQSSERECCQSCNTCDWVQTLFDECNEELHKILQYDKSAS